MTNRPGGFAVLVILWMLALLALIADRMIIVGQTETRIASNLRKEAVAESAADGGVFEAIYRLMQTRPGVWKVDGHLHDLQIGTTLVGVRLENEAGKINPNTAKQSVLQALLLQLGQPPERAQALSQAIVDWRTPHLSPGQAQRISADYRAAGLPQGASHAPFVTIAQLGGVIGMTPDTLAQLAPHLTVDDPGGQNPGPLDPAVAAVLRQFAPTPPTTGAAPAAIASQIRTLTIRAVAAERDTSFERDAIVKIGGPGGYRILVWSSDRD